MKQIQKIFLTSNGSIYFAYELNINNNKLINFNIEDEKTFFLNKKSKERQFDSKYSLNYQKKYVLTNKKWNVAKRQGTRFWCEHSKVRILLFQN